MEGLKLQKDIRDNCEELRDALSDICKWEKEMKEKEKYLMSKEKDEQKQPVRSFIKQQSRPKHIPDIKKSVSVSSDARMDNDENTASARKTRADKCKEKGNYHVKIEEYEQAVKCYTDAIELYKSDPVFYTNRALCYLKLEKYMDCINDCNQALRLNPKTVKAFYRRMQAYEGLGELEKALQECKNILEIAPQNPEANKSLERINKKLEDKKPPEKSSTAKIKKAIGKPIFTELSNEMKVIEAINKPAHLRSKKALKRIAIRETFGGPANSEKESKNVENSSIASNYNTHIPDEIIDKLFNSNEYSNYKQIHKKITPLPDLETDKILLRKSSIIPPAPQTTGQFYVTWKELSPGTKYEYLRSIKVSNLNKILGAGLDSETLSDILRVLSEYYTKNENAVHDILRELSKNNQIDILTLFFSDADRAALKKLIAYMQDRKDSADDIGLIKSKYNIV